MSSQSYSDASRLDLGQRVKSTPRMQPLFPSLANRNALESLDRALIAEMLENRDLVRYLNKVVAFLDRLLANLLYRQNPTIKDFEVIRVQENMKENGIAYKIVHICLKIPGAHNA